ncbi:MAG: His-Xaa-Ser system radical SAM maturase HxsB, partial [Deltaproteobacteria bacterium]
PPTGSAPSRRVSEQRPAGSLDHLGFFRFGRVGDRVVLTNDAGEWLTLDEPDFAALIAGTLDPGHPRHPDLQRLGILRDGAPVDELAERVARKKRYLGLGPHLHVLVTTRRCNQSCSYCHASRTTAADPAADMSPETARAAVDLALQSNAGTIVFEFQGGEPTLNMAAIEATVSHARRVAPDRGKQVEFALVSNLTAMDEDKARWLLDHDVQVCTSLDGPRDLHDGQRRWFPDRPVGAFDTVIHWISWFNQRYVEMGRDPELWHVDALLTTTRQTLRRWREVVDLYRSLRIRNLHLRPLNPYGFAVAAWRRIGYDVDEFLAVYEQVLDHIIQLNLDGHEMIEGQAALVLTKLLTPDDPNYVDLRSPCGAGFGQLATAPDGAVHPCDEARMLTAMGDDRFILGAVDDLDMRQTLGHPTVRAMAVASLLDTLPGCADCWNLPFCGVCPVHSWRTQSDLFGQRPRSSLCRLNMGISRMLIDRLDRDANGDVHRVLHRWTLRRPRSAESCLSPTGPP